MLHDSRASLFWISATSQALWTVPVQSNSILLEVIYYSSLFYRLRNYYTHTQKLTLPMLTGEAWFETWESWLPRLNSFHFSRILSTIRFRIFNVNVFQQQEKSVAARKWATFSLKLVVHTLKLLLHICTYTWKQTHKDNHCNILCKSRN